jgi:hypothetical protein
VIRHDSTGKDVDVEISLQQVDDHVVKVGVKTGLSPQEGKSTFSGTLKEISEINKVFPGKVVIRGRFRHMLLGKAVWARTNANLG